MTSAARGDLSVKKTARRVLSDKLGTVRKYLVLLFERPTEAERIHKLRVAVRRATTALDSFALCLPRPVHKHARRVLRTVRRAAGAARDWDVFFPAVAEWAKGQPDLVRPFTDALLGWSAAKRDSAQSGVSALAEGFPGTLDKMADDTLAALRRPKDDPSVSDIAHHQIEALQTELAAACDPEPASDADFHHVRIVGKRLRYAAELFVEHVPDAERIDAEMRSLQDVLGRLNDGVVGARHLAEFADHYARFHPAEWERLKQGADALGEHFAYARNAERIRFREWRTSHGERPA